MIAVGVSRDNGGDSIGSREEVEPQQWKQQPWKLLLSPGGARTAPSHWSCPAGSDPTHRCTSGCAGTRSLGPRPASGIGHLGEQ